MDNSAKAITGAIRSFSVRVNGSLKTTFGLSEALEKFQRSSALLTLLFSFGSKNTASKDDLFRKQGRSNIGGTKALITPCGTGVENLTRDGLGESHRNGKPSTPAKSGKQPVRLYGSVITRRAVDAGSTKTTHRICLFIFITSFRSQIKSFGQNLLIWFFCVKPVTFTSIHGGI